MVEHDLSTRCSGFMDTNIALADQCNLVAGISLMEIESAWLAGWLLSLFAALFFCICNDSAL
ncbi:MAG: hypothetical protein ACE5I1_10610 [bacterium]